MAACWPRHSVSTAARPMGGCIDKSQDSSGSDNRGRHRRRRARMAALSKVRQPVEAAFATSGMRL